MKARRRSLSFAAFLFMAGLSTAAFGQTTAFTYQGHLKQNGSPANGNFNMTFKLFDAPAPGGTQQGSTLTFDGAGGNPAPVSVASGLFTVQLDFGVGPYTANQNRWLEIAVGGTTLTPRQALTPTPFALNTRGVNVASSGNVGIGTSAPAQKLSVVGTVQSTSGGFMFPDGTTQTTASVVGPGFWTSSGANIFNNNTGNVGIGRTNPSFKLDTNSTNGLGARIGMEAAGGGALVVACNPGDNRVWLEGYNSTDDGHATEMLVTGFAGGSLPQLTLKAANTTAQGLLTLDAGGDAAIFTGTGNSELNRYLAILNTAQFQSASGLKAGGILCSDNFFYANPGKNDLIVKGVVGIGTPTPGSSLTIQTVDSIFSSGVGWTHTDGTRDLSSICNSSGGWLGTRSNHALNFYTNNSAPRMTVTASGLVGVNTTAPPHQFTVATGAGQFGVVHTDGIREVGTYVSASGGWLGTRSSHSLHFFTGNSNPLMTLATTGNLGIGTTGPAQKLDVNGTARVKILEVVGADVAEKFPCSEAKPDPGSVMEIDPDQAGKLRLSRDAYNGRVAGVVSGAGDLSVGAVLGHLPGNEDAPPIALSGRVWVKCDAATAAINPGDMLTTSTTPGHAMKAADRDKSYGAVIGKAMTNLAKGKSGLVLVLVNLQ